MIIDKEGNIVEAFFDTQGIVYKTNGFTICLPFNEIQKEQFIEMRQLKQNLRATDFKASKYAEGLYTEEEYAPIRLERQQWRDEWNEINNVYNPPTITEEEISEAIRSFYEKHPEFKMGGGMING